MKVQYDEKDTGKTCTDDCYYLDVNQKNLTHEQTDKLFGIVVYSEELEFSLNVFGKPTVPLELAHKSLMILEAVPIKGSAVSKVDVKA